MDAPIISFKWNNSLDFLNVNGQELEFSSKGKSISSPLSNLLSIKLQSKKKLAPLVIGAVLSSLALVNILLEGAGLSMIGLLSIGVLILYFGLSEYWVINLELFKEGRAFWISKAQCASFPLTLINIIDYRVSKGFFPPFYTSVPINEIDQYVGVSTALYQLPTPLKFYLTPPKQEDNMQLLKVDIEKLYQTLSFEANQTHLATATLQINKEAII